MIYGYARVSTVGQARDGNSLEDQRAKLVEAGATKVYVDSFTGTKIDRPEFDKLKAALKEGDTVVVTKLDRIARNAAGGITLVDSLIERGVKVHILNMGMMDNTPTGKLIRHIMFAFAEFERDMIVQRTAEGKAVARQRDGYREGRPAVEYDKELFAELYADVRAGALCVHDAAEQLGVSRAKWYRIVKDNCSGAA